MAFFPQEDHSQLVEMRKKLTPFLKAVSKALLFELENSEARGGYKTKEKIFDEILDNAPNTAESSFFPDAAKYLRTFTTHLRL